MMPYDHAVETIETENFATEPPKTLPVEVVNFPTVEQEKSQSVSTNTIVDVGTIVQILTLDPLRTKANLFISGVGTVTLCHTENQAQDVVNRGITNNTSGATVQCPGATAGSINFAVEHTAPMWAVLLGASPALSIIQERRYGR